MMAHRTRWFVAALTCGGLLRAGSALAFSDPASYGLSPIEAGGGGRYFTGSPADAYTCKACHSGGAEPSVSVLGLPLVGYRPSARYEIIVKWPAEFKRISLGLEFTDNEGAVAGSVRLPPEGEIEDPEYCVPVSARVLAAQLNETSDGRQIIGVPDCGSTRVRFLWTAPTTDVGPVWFAGSMVSSDGQADPYHDGVTDFGRILGTPATASNTTGSCSVRHGPAPEGHRGSLVIAWIVVAGVLLRRRRRAGRTST